MATVLGANRFFVEDQEPCYYVNSNLTNYFEVGARDETPYYLEARIEDGEYLIDAVLLIPGKPEPVRISRGRPVSQGFDQKITDTGYRIVDESDRVVLAAEDQGGYCLVDCTVYDEQGAVVAESRDDCFVIHRGPAIIGKKGNTRGIVMRG